MPWYVYSILTALCFSGLALCTRKIANLGFSTLQNLTFLCTFVFIGFVIIEFLNPSSIWKSNALFYFLLISFIAGIFSVVGNLGGFEGVKRAPNPGYSEAIKSSGILPITMLSIVLFNSRFEPIKLLGALLIVTGIAILVVERKKISRKDFKYNNWFIYPIIALSGFTFATLLLKYATQFKGVSSVEINLILFFVLSFSYLLLSHKQLKGYFDKKNLRLFLPFIILASGFSLVGNYFSMRGLSLAPNAGYNEAIKNSSSLFVTIFSVIFFSSNFNLVKMLGVLIIIIGAAVLIL